MAESRFQKGDRVRFRFGPYPLEGVVSEDRGPIGMNGRRLYGVRFLIDPSAEETSYTELPAAEMELVAAAAAN